MWVVKLWGGLEGDPWLPRWLDELARLGGGRVVIVPGAGQPATAAGQASAPWPVSELAAHSVAMLAMAQAAALLHSLCPRLGVARDEAGIGRILRRGEVPVWMPLSALRDEADELTVPGSAADCVAAWLSRRLNAERLLLVVDSEPDSELTLEALVERGLVDAALPHFARRSVCPVDLMFKQEVERLRDDLLWGHPRGLPGA